MPAIRRPRTLPFATIGGGVTLTPVGLTVTPAEVTLEPEETQQLTAVVSDERGSALTVQLAAGASVLSPIAVEYESDDTDVATVSASGLVTAVADGEAVITATVTGTSITDTVAVTVATPEP